MAENFFTKRTKNVSEKTTVLSSSKDNYEAHSRKRKFVPSWKEEFPWISCRRIEELYSSCPDVAKLVGENGEVIVCVWCRESHYKKYQLPVTYKPSPKEMKESPFVFGSVSFRKPGLQSHCAPSNSLHAFAKTRHANLSREVRGELSVAQQTKKALNETTRGQVANLFINCYGLMKHGRSFSDITFLSDLDVAKGGNVGNI